MNEPMKLKIISLNIWLGGLLFEEIVEFLKAQDPDILMLQEVFDGKDISLEKRFRAFSVLKNELGYKYSDFAPAFIENIGENQKINQGNAIFSRFAIKNSKTCFYDIPFGERIDQYEYFPVTPRNLQHVTINLADQTQNSVDQVQNLADQTQNEPLLHVLNTQGIWGTHGEDTERRTEMGKVILNEIGNNQPLILAGDFNFNPDTKVVENISKTLESVFKTELVTSFNLARKDLVKDPGYATAAVDMMFVSNDIEIISKSCLNVDISDHLPLVVEVNLVPHQ
ncbi:endonuclease/exonuclease/phosphatase family protein [Candidatus Woesebacteria bacterium]|nr:endonuclease/exonuclease/phosphatase family protein [Candidatus Woesebacteria bacterium]